MVASTGETEVTGYGPHPLALIDPASGHIGKGGIPPARLARGEQRHNLGLDIGRNDRGHLGDALLQQGVERYGARNLLQVEQTVEKLLDLVRSVVEQGIGLAH